MITLLHGDNVSASRENLWQMWQKFQGKERLRLTGKEISVEKVSQVTRTDSLFGQERVLVLEGLFTQPLSIRKTLVLLMQQSGMEVILWEKKKLTTAQIKTLGSVAVKEFKISKALFAFLEALSPGRVNRVMELFRMALSQEEAEMILAMIERQLRLLLLVKNGDLANLPEWQGARLASQARNFSEEQLKRMYADLVDLDWKRKTSRLPVELPFALDLYLFDHLS